MKRKNFLCALLVALVALTALSGCSGNGESSSQGSEATLSSTESGDQKRYDGVTINMVCINSLWNDIVTESLPELEEQTGIKGNLQQYTNEQTTQKIAVSMAAGGTDIDIVVYAPSQSQKHYTSNGWLYPITEFVESDPDFDYEDITQSCREICTTDGEIYGIPYQTEREVLMYNKKMLEEKGIEVPTTFEELESAAAALNDPDNNISGIALRGKGQAAVTQFSGFLYSFGGDFLDEETMTATINTPEAIEAFDYYGRLAREYGPVGSINMNWQETQALFSQGMAAMRVDCDSQYGYAIDPSSSLIAEDAGIAVFPAGPAGAKPFNITSWAMGISYGSPNKEAAWEFISWAMSKEMDLKTMKDGANPSARDSTWENEEAIQAFPEELVQVVNETLPIAVDTDRPKMINVGDARTEIGNVIIASIEGQDVQAAADKANDALQKLLDEEK